MVVASVFGEGTGIIGFGGGGTGIGLGVTFGPVEDLVVGRIVVLIAALVVGRAVVGFVSAALVVGRDVDLTWDVVALESAALVVTSGADDFLAVDAIIIGFLEVPSSRRFLFGTASCPVRFKFSFSAEGKAAQEI